LVGPGGDIIARKSLDNSISSDGKYLTAVYRGKGYRPLVGAQMKYVYLFDKSLKYDFIDFNDIPSEVRMYKGKRQKHKSNVS